MDVYLAGTARIDIYDIWQNVVGTHVGPTGNRVALLDDRAVRDSRNTDEQCREPKRRSRAVLKWKIFRRRSVTAAVRRCECTSTHDIANSTFYTDCDCDCIWDLRVRCWAQNDLEPGHRQRISFCCIRRRDITLHRIPAGLFAIVSVAHS